MSRIVANWFALLLASGSFAGCKHTAKYDTDVPSVEEFRAPPNEDRFNNPPERGYTKPQMKKEFKPKGAPGGMNGGGMGAPPQY